MIKLKKTTITNLVNYQPFLKNNSLINMPVKSKRILFENPILYKNINLGSYAIEFKRHENIYLPFTLLRINEISTIKQCHQNIILFNYDLTANIVHQFTKIMFPHSFQEKHSIIKGRLLGGGKYNKKILILILGLVFFMKPINLHNGLNYKRKRYFNKYTKKKFYRQKVNSARLINSYKFRYLNFKINDLGPRKRIRKELSRLDYIKIILKNKKILNKNLKSRYRKSLSFKNQHVKRKKFKK